MNRRRFGAETVTVLRGGTVKDRYGNDRIDFTTPTRTRIDGCAVAPRGSTETAGGRTGVIVGLTLFLPAGVDITAADRVEVRGDVWTVEGQPGEWRDPFTGTPIGVEVAVEAVHG